MKPFSATIEEGLYPVAQLAGLVAQLAGLVAQLAGLVTQSGRTDGTVWQDWWRSL